jgi:peptidoglycan/xylan/chitin deacetylase (PgdA/CDA1 family)
VQASAVLKPVIYRGPKATSGKVVYLTFDDGPSRYTPAVLNVLKSYDAKATFFVVGSQIRTREAMTRRIAREGHSVQNHTWRHPNLTRLSSTEISSQFTRTNRAIRRQGIPQPVCQRPPYGALNNRVRRVSQTLGMRTVMWSLDANDWRRPGASAIARRVVRGTSNGTIVLMHDGGGNRSQTVTALKSALRTLKARGYRFETLPACP